MFKKIFYFLTIVLILIMGLAVLIPYLYQDEIKERLLEEVNKDLNGELTIDGFSIQLIKSFPDLRLVLRDVNITSTLDTTASLFNAQQIALDLDIMSVINDDESVVVNAIKLDDPFLFIGIDTDGNANYNIYKGEDDATNDESSGATYAFQISDYQINNGHFIYRDVQTGTMCELKDLEHTGQGNFEGDELQLSTLTEIKLVDVIAENTTYLKEANVSADIDVEYNTTTGKINLKENLINLNELKLEALGWLQPDDDGIEMDLDITAPGNDFGELWSVIPPSFKKSIANVKTNGAFAFAGKINGRYNYEEGSLPNMSFKIDIDNGSVSYPEIPQKLTDIFADLTFKKKEGSANNFFDIQRFELRAGKSFLKTKAAVSQNGDNLFADGFAKINMDLVDLPTDMKNEGKVIADFSFAGKYDDIENENYGDLKFDGTASIQQVKIKSADFPQMVIDIPELAMNPSRIKGNQVDIKIGRSDVQGNIDIANPLGFLVAGKKPVINMQTSSKMMDLNELMGSEKTSSAQNTESNSIESDVVANFLPYDMDIDWSGTIDQLNYAEYIINDLSGSLKTDGKDVKISEVEANYNDSKFYGNANLQQIPQFLNESGDLKGKLNISGRSLDLNKFMTTEEDVSQGEAETAGILILPENMDIDINTDIKELIYSDLTIRDLKGDLSLVNQAVDFNEVTASFLDGEMALMGNFTSNGLTPPAFNFKYDINKMPFQGITQQIDFIDKLIPISKYIDGIFNSTLVLEGLLTENMTPDLNSLSASGYIETLKGALGNIPFLDNLSKKVAVKELQGLKIENTKNWFEIKDGKFILQPFDYSFEGMDFKINGSTGLNQVVSLNINADIPKEKFDQLPGGNQVNKGISWLTSEANSRGLPFGEIKSYKLGIDINGDVMSPAIKVKLLDFTKGSISNSIDEKKEELKKKVIDTLEQKKEEVIKETKEKINEKKEEVIDTIKKTVQKEVNKKVDVIKDEIKKQTNEKVDSLIDKNGKEAIDKIKDKLGKWDVFKKKK